MNQVASDDNGARTKGKRGWRINAALTFASLAVVLAGLECALRGAIRPDMSADVDGTALTLGIEGDRLAAFTWDGDGNSLVHVKSPNKRLVYELRPNVELNDFIRINAHGFRDREYDKKKPEGVYRICAIGDSVTFGWWERLEETYPKVLEALLNGHAREGTRFEVLNMGVGGYNAEQEMELFRSKALAFEPDMLIIGYCSNDHGIGADAGLWRHFSRSGSFAWDWISLRALQARELFSRKTLVQRSYKQIAQLAHDRDMPVLAVFFYPKDAPPDWTYFIPEEMAHAETLGFAVLNLLPVFEAYPWDDVMRDSFHPTTLGHEIAAKAIFQQLCEWSRLPLDCPPERRDYGS